MPSTPSAPAVTQLPGDLSRSLERIAAQSERMGRLVEDLLLLARLDSGRPLAEEDVDIVRVVLDVVDDARTDRARTIAGG